MVIGSMTKSVTQIKYVRLLAKEGGFFSSEVSSCYSFQTDDYAANVEGPTEEQSLMGNVKKSSQ